MPSIKRQATTLLKNVLHSTEQYNEFAEKKNLPKLNYNGPVKVKSFIDSTTEKDYKHTRTGNVCTKECRNCSEGTSCCGMPDECLSPCRNDCEETCKCECECAEQSDSTEREEMLAQATGALVITVEELLNKLTKKEEFVETLKNKVNDLVGCVDKIKKYKTISLVLAFVFGLLSFPLIMQVILFIINNY